MYFYDVGFIEKSLSSFTVHPSTTTSLNIARTCPFYPERLWLTQGLLCYRDIRESHPQLKWLRLLEVTHALRLQLIALIYVSRFSQNL